MDERRSWLVRNDILECVDRLSLRFVSGISSIRLGIQLALHIQYSHIMMQS